VKTQPSSTTLRIAYCAVKAQLSRGDKDSSWLDAEMRDVYVKAVADLELQLRVADKEKEILARGGEKLLKIV
jgi:hypothetical protein